MHLVKNSIVLQAAALGFLATGSFAFAGTIHGTVTNKTVNKPSSGDEVALLSLSSAMDEVGHAKTDAQGHFTLTTPTNEPYLIRVEHQKGAYFKNVPPGTTDVAITVYDVAPKVEGISTEADVLRVEAENNTLKVTENYFVKNISSPPRTQTGERNYEVVLPPEATLDGAATVGPSGMPLAATPDPVSPKGHYAFSFPIRPNEGEQGTRFQLTYHLPYSGSYTFKPKLIQGADNLAVMLPKSIKFAPGAGTSFQTVPDDTSGQTFLERNIASGQSVEFAISGTGARPRDSEAGAAGSDQGQAGAGQAPAVGGPNGAPGGGLGDPIATPDPLSKYKWWIAAGLALVLAVAAAFFLRKPASAVGAAAAALPIERIDGPVRPFSATSASLGAATSIGPAASLAPASATAPAAYVAPVSGAHAPAGSKSQLLLEALKEELFAVESEKIAGKLSPEDYAEVKSALEIVLRRALLRG